MTFREFGPAGPPQNSPLGPQARQHPHPAAGMRDTSTKTNDESEKGTAMDEAACSLSDGACSLECRIKIDILGVFLI